METDSADDTFNLAHKRFLSGLSNEQRGRFAHCDSVHNLLMDMEKWTIFAQNSHTLTKCLHNVKTFAKNLEPYLKTIEVVCGPRSEWAKVTLGILRLVLQISSNYLTFFEKLCYTIERMDANFPRYQELYDRLHLSKQSPTPALRNSLKKTYELLFDFFQDVVRVFSRRDGSVKGTSMIMLSLSWKPFDVRYRKILNEINFHHSIVKEELEFATAEAIQNDLRKIRNAQAEQAGNHRFICERLNGLQTGKAPDKAQLDFIESLLIHGNALQATEKSQDRITDLLSEFMDTQAEQTKENFKRSFIRWINPQDYKENLSDARGERDAGTAEWVFQNTTFNKWREDIIKAPDQRKNDLGQPLWINGPFGPRFSKSKAADNNAIKGKPGSGKTILAGSIIDELQRNQQSSPLQTVVCYYFFSKKYGRNNSEIDTYRSILAQLFHQCIQFQDHCNIFSFAALDLASDTWASEDEVLDIIGLCLGSIHQSYLVFDGVDECTNESKFLKRLRAWGRIDGVKILVLSRPDVLSLRRTVPSPSTITMVGSILSTDIFRSLTPKFNDFREDGMFSENTDTNALAQHLASRAEGMFLWAHVMVEYLKSPVLTGSERVEIIMDKTPGGLDRLEDLYCRIQDRIDLLDKPSRDLAHKALLWVAHTQITLPELKEATITRYQEASGNHESQQFEHAVIVSCRGLVEKKANGVLRYIHVTARNFVQNGPEKSQRLPMLPSEHLAKAQIITECVNYLKEGPSRKPPSSRIDAAEYATATRNRPFLKLCSSQWINIIISLFEGHRKRIFCSHLRKLSTTVYDFLKSGESIMAWIETLYALFPLGITSHLQKMRKDLEAFLGQELSKELRYLLLNLKDLVDDIYQIDLEWGETLLPSPYEIWNDITMFQKSRFLSQTRAGYVESPASNLCGQSSEAFPRPLFSESRSSVDSTRLAVLGVYPCKFFRDGWEKHSNIPYYSDAPERLRRPKGPETRQEFNDACFGWTVTYEIFSIEPTKTRQLMRIEGPLDPPYVEMCLRQNLAADSNDWICSFPMAIGPTLETFMLLNMLVCADLAQPCVIPLDWPLQYRPSGWSRAKGIGSNLALAPRLGSYTYEFMWSLDEQYLLFKDRKLAPMRWVEDGSCVAIFAVKKTPNGLRKADFLRCFFTRSFSTGIFKCQFHPTDALLLLQDDAKFYMWRFEEDPRPTALQFSEPEEQSTAIIDGLSFSSCGKFLTVSYRSQPWPELYRLDDIPRSNACTANTHLLNENQVKTISRRGKSETTQAERGISVALLFTANKTSSHDSGIVSKPDFTRNVDSSTVVVTSGEDQQFGMTRCSVSAHEIKLHHKSNTLNSATSLVKLPHSIPTQYVQAQVTAPDTNDSHGQCRVILNTGPTKVFLSSEPVAADHLPVIIRKDTRTLRVHPSDRPPRGNPSEINGEECDERESNPNFGVEFGDYSESCHTQN